MHVFVVFRLNGLSP